MKFKDAYPKNLYKHIVDTDDDIEMTPELAGSIEYVIISINSERESDIIHLYYKDGLSLKDIGIKYGVRPERIRQIKAKTLRRMRHPKYFKFIRFGGIQAFLEKECMSSYDEGYTVGCKQGYDKYKEVIENEKSAFINKPIGELELTLRSYNCLRRAGINTVKDITNLTEDELMKIRNLGRKSANEIVNILETMDLHLKLEC